MPLIRLFHSDTLPGDYSVAATAPAGSRYIFLAGASPLDDEGRITPVGDIAGQARQCLRTMAAALALAGAGLTDVITTRVLVAATEREDLYAAWQVVAETFGAHAVPSTLLGVTVLGYPDQLVEIEAVAAVPGSGAGAAASSDA